MSKRLCKGPVSDSLSLLSFGIRTLAGLSKKQVAALWTRFNELDCDARGESKGFKGYLDADDFGRVPKFDENPIAPRLIKVIFDDFGDDEKLTFAQFVHFMSTFGQTERHKHRPSIPMAMTSSKTDQEKVKFSADDSPKLRKIKFMFRVNETLKVDLFTSARCLDVRHRSRWTSLSRRYSRNIEDDGQRSS